MPHYFSGSGVMKKKAIWRKSAIECKRLKGKKKKKMKTTWLTFWAAFRRDNTWKERLVYIYSPFEKLSGADEKRHSIFL